MSKRSVSETIPGSTTDVFTVIHDYDLRLEWDTLLQSAYVEKTFEKADLGAVTVCKAKAYLGGIEIRTKYVTFQPAKVAAVVSLNRPLFFDTFAASIRHFEESESRSVVTYEFNFKARPTVLRPLLHPIMTAFLKWETRKRLHSLRKYFERGC